MLHGALLEILIVLLIWFTFQLGELLTLGKMGRPEEDTLKEGWIEQSTIRNGWIAADP